MKKKVIIIGAGPAGLTAAYELLKQPDAYSVCVLEASDAIGGISKTVRHNGNRMDIGGHRFFSKDMQVVNWWNEILPMQGAPAYDDLKLNRTIEYPQNGVDPQLQDEVFLIRRRVSRIYFNNAFFDYPIRMNATTLRNMGFITTLKAGFSYLKTNFKKLPETSLENFYINRFGKVLYGMFFEGYTEKLWGRHPRDISADWGAQRVKGLSVTAIIKDIFSKIFTSPKKRRAKVETSLIEEFFYPKFGPGQLWETVAKHIQNMGGTIAFQSRVVGFHQTNNTIQQVICETPAGQTCLDADIVISSMPINALIAGLEQVPQNVQKIAAGLKFRDFVTVGLLVSKLNLQNNTPLKTLGNIPPDCWIYVQDTNVKLGRIQIFNNWSPYMVANPDETVWMGLEYFCEEGDAFWTMDNDARVQLAIEELMRMGVISGPDVVLDAHCERVQKAYPAYFDTYAQIDEAIAYINTIPNLYCVGRNGQHRYNNMDHSMATAFRTVEAIVSGSANRMPIWEVNTEQEYHEQKS